MTGSFLGSICSFVFGALLLGLFIAADRIGRRNQALRNSGVARGGRLAEDWSFESVSAVLVGIDPARLAPGPEQAGWYDDAVIAILEALPIEQSTDEATVEAVVANGLSLIPDAAPTAPEVARVSHRLLRMHEAAHSRWTASDSDF